ncbi:hypothetical protein BDV93DRAFT_564601 [Ceratobasidium sp. AG-I]|nr:hypothetical protein BDV93DRAFT_564601 [Ceratobasidium sp. AG-I]
MPPPSINPIVNVLNATSLAISGAFEHPVERLHFPQILDSWYRDKEYLQIKEMQHRKELNRPFFHEFILVVLGDNTKYRFDRRPDRNTIFSTLLQLGSDAFDTIQQVDDIDDSCHPPSECLAVLDFDPCIKLSLILAICFAIQVDEKACRYTVQKYNCYFFSWAIISSVARYLVAWEDLPKSSNFLQILGKTESDAIAEAIIKGLVKTLPYQLPDTLSTAASQMLADIFPNSISRGESPLHEYLHDLIEHALSPQALEVKLGMLTRTLPSIIRLALQNPSFLEKLKGSAREVLTNKGDSLGYEARKALGDAIKPILWYNDVDPKIFDDSILSSESWSCPEYPGYLFGDEQIWCVCAESIASEVLEAIETPASMEISKQVHLMLVKTLPGKGHPNTVQYRNIVDQQMAKIEEIVTAAIMVATRKCVYQEVVLVRENENASRMAAKRSMHETIKEMFPDTLPAILRIPASRTSTKLFWLLQPESVLCLWRSRYKLRPCEKLSHKELQAYILKRIKVLTRDARFLGHSSTYNAEIEIREALGRVWVTSIDALTGMCLEDGGT